MKIVPFNNMVTKEYGGIKQKNGTVKNKGRLTAGRVYEIPDELAKKWIAAKIAEKHTPVKVTLKKETANSKVKKEVR